MRLTGVRRPEPGAEPPVGTFGDDELIPEMRRFRQALADGYAAHPPLDSVDLAQARRICEQVRAPLARGEGALPSEPTA